MRLETSKGRSNSTLRVIVVTEEAPWYTKPLKMMLVTTVLLFAIGAYMTHSRNEARKIADAKESDLPSAPLSAAPQQGVWL